MVHGDVGRGGMGTIDLGRVWPGAAYRVEVLNSEMAGPHHENWRAESKVLDLAGTSRGCRPAHGVETICGTPNAEILTKIEGPKMLGPYNDRNKFSNGHELIVLGTLSIFNKC
jgi:hypothetical protein